MVPLPIRRFRHQTSYVLILGARPSMGHPGPGPKSKWRNAETHTLSVFQPEFHQHHSSPLDKYFARSRKHSRKHQLAEGSLAGLRWNGASSRLARQTTRLVGKAVWISERVVSYLSYETAGGGESRKVSSSWSSWIVWSGGCYTWIPRFLLIFSPHIPYLQWYPALCSNFFSADR